MRSATLPTILAATLLTIPSLAAAQTTWHGQIDPAHPVVHVDTVDDAVVLRAGDHEVRNAGYTASRFGATTCVTEDHALIAVGLESTSSRPVLWIFDVVSGASRYIGLEAAPASKPASLIEDGVCVMGVLDAKGGLVLGDVDGARARVAGAALPVPDLTELPSGLLLAAHHDRFIAADHINGISSFSGDGELLERRALDAPAQPGVVFSEADEAVVWFMTRSGSLMAWRGGEVPRQMARSRPSLTGLTPWPGVGVVWGDQAGVVHVFDGVRARNKRLSKQPLRWPIISVPDATDSSRSSPLVITDQGVAHVLGGRDGDLSITSSMPLGMRLQRSPRLAKSEGTPHLIAHGASTSPRMVSLQEVFVDGLAGDDELIAHAVSSQAMMDLDGVVLASGEQVRGGRVVQPTTHIEFDPSRALDPELVVAPEAYTPVNTGESVASSPAGEVDGDPSARPVNGCQAAPSSAPTAPTALVFFGLAVLGARRRRSSRA